MLFSPLDEPIREEHGAREQVDLKDQNPARSCTRSPAGTSFLHLLDLLGGVKNLQHSSSSFDHCN